MRRIALLSATVCFALPTAFSAGVAFGQVTPGPAGGPPPVGCPEGTVQATPPLNPVLGCIPTDLAAETLRWPAAPQPPLGCPDGWVPAVPPVNPMLGCLPDTLVDVSGGMGGFQRMVMMHPFDCPEGWASATVPVNPMLGCLPTTVVPVPPPGTRFQPFLCPDGWVIATPPLNPILRCVPGSLAAVLMPQPAEPERPDTGRQPE